MENDCQVEFPDNIHFSCSFQVVLIYPGTDAKTLEDYVDHLKESSFKHVETTVSTSQDETVQPTSHIQDCEEDSSNRHCCIY